MSIPHQITNHVTGQVIRFIKKGSDTHGELLEMEAVYASFSNEPPLHFHPFQEEFFEVLAGELTVRIASEIRTYRKGEIVHVKPGMHHSMWNAGYADAMVNWKVYPALDTEQFLTTLTELANQGQTNMVGVPSLPLMLFLLKKYKATFRLAKLNGKSLSILSALFAPIFLFKQYKRKMNRPIPQYQNQFSSYQNN